MNPNRLFCASCVALIVTAMSFALRGGAASAWAGEFHLSNEQIGWINGTAFWGFTLAMIVGGPLCDLLGLGAIMRIAFVGHLAGVLLTIFAWDYWSLYAGTLIFGIANGSVEAACNPLITTLFPGDKTTKLNAFHVWFPGGIVIGGLLAYLLGHLGLGWKIQFACMLIPLAAYGMMFMREKFPKTERVEQGISTGTMFAACLNPLFILMVACMLLTAATELAPNQWIPNILTNAGVSGMLVLVWITGIQAVGRMFAGVFVHRIAPEGMLLASAAISAIGLYALSISTGAMLFAAATVFAVGVCFFWPTMLGYVSERFPKTGALGLAIMGGAGMLSVSIVLPVMGRIYDAGIAARLTPGEKATAVIEAAAGLQTLGRVAALPCLLLVVFCLVFFLQKRSETQATKK